MPNNHLVLNKLKPSRWFILLLVFMHGLAAWSVSLLPFTASIELAVKYFLFILVMFSCFYYYRKMQNIIAIIMKVDNRWDLLKSDGVYCADNQLIGSYISDWLVILVFSGEDGSGRYYVYLCVDVVDKAVLSDLKCKLKINKQELFQE